MEHTMENQATKTAVLDTRFNTIDLSDKSLKWIDIDGKEETYTEVSQYIRPATQEEYEEIYQTICEDEYDSPEDIISFWDVHNFKKIAFEFTNSTSFHTPEILAIIESEDAYQPDYALVVDHEEYRYTSGGQEIEGKNDYYYILISGTCRQADFPKIKKISKMDTEDFTIDFVNEEGL